MATAKTLPVMIGQGQQFFLALTEKKGHFSKTSAMAGQPSGLKFDQPQQFLHLGGIVYRNNREYGKGIRLIGTPWPCIQIQHDPVSIRTGFVDPLLPSFRLHNGGNTPENRKQYDSYDENHPFPLHSGMLRHYSFLVRDWLCRFTRGPEQIHHLPLHPERITQRVVKLKQTITGEHCRQQPQMTAWYCMEVIGIDHAFDRHSIGLIERDFAGHRTYNSGDFCDNHIEAVFLRIGTRDNLDWAKSRIADEFCPPDLAACHADCPFPFRNDSGYRADQSSWATDSVHAARPR